MYCNVNIETNSVYTDLGLHRLLKMLLNHISRRPKQAIFIVTGALLTLRGLRFLHRSQLPIDGRKTNGTALESGF